MALGQQGRLGAILVCSQCKPVSPSITGTDGFLTPHLSHLSRQRATRAASCTRRCLSWLLRRFFTLHVSPAGPYRLLRPRHLLCPRTGLLRLRLLNRRWMRGSAPWLHSMGGWTNVIAGVRAAQSSCRLPSKVPAVFSTAECLHTRVFRPRFLCVPTGTRVGSWL